MKRVSIASFILAAGLVAFTGCVVYVPPEGNVYAEIAPPVPQVEVIGVAPGPDHVWVHGHYIWTDRTYVWNPGRWQTRPRSNAVWVEGSWRHHSRGWYWTEGHWR